jgi:aspartyl-tRNA(Asn)/glutamyl-tRNA(Gln) amidotransferase subunit A
MLAAMAGHDPADPGSVAGPALSGGAAGGIAGLRVGYVRHFHETDAVADGEVAAALDGVAAALRELGATVRDAVLPPLGQFVAVNRVILAAESWSIHAPWLRSRPGDYAAMTRRRLMTGAFLGAGEYVGAQRARLAMIGAVNAAFDEFDVLLCASSLDPACRMDDEAEVQRTYSRQCRMPFNVTGHPALAMMSGLSRGGLPLSLQLVGPFFADERLLRVAAAYEAVAAWRGERPALAA